MMICRFVIDSSVAVKWLVPEPGAEIAIALHGWPLAAPDLLRIECGNVLWKWVRSGRLTADEGDQLHAVLGRAPVTWVSCTELEREAFRIACALDHPIYDCFYLALAERERRPLVTEDRRLIQTAGRHDRFRSLVLSLADARPHLSP